MTDTGTLKQFGSDNVCTDSLSGGKIDGQVPSYTNQVWIIAGNGNSELFDIICFLKNRCKPPTLQAPRAREHQQQQPAHTPQAPEAPASPLEQETMEPDKERALPACGVTVWRPCPQLFQEGTVSI